MASPPVGVPPFVPMAPPPLPVGWTEHVAPGGRPYYFNTYTKESTYVRPLPHAFPVPPVQVPAPAQPAKKKEKPAKKVQIPGTDWVRVTTTEGNVFYTHKVEKRSVWTVPEDINDAVEALERGEVNSHEQTLLKSNADNEAEEEVKREVKRVKREAREAAKRKAEEAVPVDEVVITKKAKVEEDHGAEEEDEDDEESEEEEWQREAAAQLAAEAEEEEKRKKEEAARVKAEAEAEAEKAKQLPQLNMPERVDLSIDEAKALFKTLLREKDINPLIPWDSALPQFVSDPRYVLLPSVSARREAFDEYCRDRARELRESQVKKEKELADPKEAFERLLREEVKSTRTSWSDFRKQWKKDRRFWGWGRDEREREKKFRQYLKDLGEKKRAAAQRTEADFFALLKESGRATPGTDWKEVKKHLYNDPRYDAVGSSSLREELFKTFLKAQGGAEPSNHETSKEDGEVKEEKNTEDKEREKREKKERAVKEREEKVRAERNKLDADINRSKMSLTLEEGEREFRTMLVDAIRDPQTTWEHALPEMKIDPRFTNSPLPYNQQLHIFHAHIGRLRTKHLDNLHVLFESHSRSLSTSFSDLPVQSLLTSLPVTKLGFDIKVLQHEYEKWQRERTSAARAAFDAMLHENSFVEFWGRLRNMGGEGVEGGVKADVEDENEGEGGGGTADMKVLAKTIDIKEVDRVLKNDKRYIMFDNVPEQRERWIRDYLSGLSAPKLSVHVPEHQH